MIDKADTYCGKCIKADVCGMEGVYDPAMTYCAYRVEARQHGEWMISPDKTRACCPFCHNKWTDAKEIALLNTAFRAKNFCEYCGADMRPREGDEKCFIVRTVGMVLICTRK